MKNQSKIDSENASKENTLDQEKIKKYEELILHLKQENNQLEEDLNSAFERENDLQKALETQKSVCQKKENEIQKQTRFDNINEIEKLNEMVFKKNREISEKIVEISNLNFKLNRMNEAYQELERYFEAEKLQTREKINNLKIDFEKKIIEKQNIEKFLNSNFSNVSLRVSTLNRKIESMMHSYRTKIFGFGEQERLLFENQKKVQRENDLLREKMKLLEKSSSKFKDEIEELKTIHALLSTNSQKEINNMRSTLKDFLDKHKLRIKTMKANCEEFLTNLFNQFSVFQSMSKKDIPNKIDFDSFFENLKKITSVKFIQLQKQNLEKMKKNSVKNSGKCENNQQKRVGTILEENHIENEKDCLKCSLLSESLANTNALIAEQKSFFDSQLKIVMNQKNSLIDEKNHLKKLFKMSETQQKSEIDALLEKLKDSQEKVLEFTKRNNILEANSTEFSILCKKIQSENIRLIENYKTMKTQKDLLESVKTITEKESKNVSELKQVCEILKNEKKRLSEYCQDLKNELIVLRDTNKNDAECLLNLRAKTEHLNMQINQKESFINSQRDKIESLKNYFFCKSHINSLESLKNTQIMKVDKESDIPSHRCIKCLQIKTEDAENTNVNTKKIKNQLGRKDELVKMLQKRLEETEIQSKKSLEELQFKIKELKSHIKVLEAENRFEQKKTSESMYEIGVLKNCIVNLSKNIDDQLKNSNVSEKSKENQHLKETCKILDLKMDDLDLFFNLKNKTSKSDCQNTKKIKKNPELLTGENEIDSFVKEYTQKIMSFVK